MRHNDRQFIQSLKAGIPTPPQSYYQKIDDTIALLKKHDEEHISVKTRHGQFVSKSLHIATACIVAVLLFVCTFAVKPSLAAELPLINNVVYALSPTIAVNAEKLNRVSELIKSAVMSFAMGDYTSASSLFYEGDNWKEDKYTYATAKYLHYLFHSTEKAPGEETTAEAVSFTVVNANAHQKAFRFGAVITLELKSKEGFTCFEEIYCELIETIDGLYITSITSVHTESDSYLDYITMCNSYGLESLQYKNISAGISFETEYLSFMTVHKNSTISTEEKLRMLEHLQKKFAIAQPDGQAQQSIIQKLEDERAALQEQITPAVMSAEELAAEVLYRYYLGRKSGTVQDFSDIMERNEATNLFFYDAQLAVDKTLAGSLTAFDEVEKGTAEILETIQSDDEHMTARFYIKTKITSGPMRGVGEEIIFTLEKRDTCWIVVGYDRTTDDGVYVNQLKPLSEQYKKAGLSWQEADEKAYKELLREIKP